MNAFCYTFDGQINCKQENSFYWTNLRENAKPYTEISGKKYYIKLITLGDSDVGKSTVIRTFCRCSLCSQDLLLQKRIMGSHRCHNKQLYLHGNSVHLRIFDTAGEERYRSITPSYYRGAHGCILMFDVTKYQTFENITLWFNDLKQYILHPENTVTILVGTKCHSPPQERKVDKVKAEALADHLEIQYMEVSSEEDINIKKLFETVTTEIIETFKRNPEVQIQQDKTYLLGIQDKNNNTENTKCSC